MAVIRYPTDITRDQSTYLKFVRARNRGFRTNELRNINDSQFETKSEDVIALPMPNAFNDLSTVNYSDVQDTSLVGQGLQSLANKADPGGKLQQEAKIKTGSTKAIQQMMLFDSVPIKNYSFTWEFIPESPEEMNNVEQIIQIFEEAKLPTYANSQERLIFPDIFKINFGGVTPKLIRFLPCIITSVSVSYSISEFTIYQDGGFPQLTLTVSFSEIAGRTRETQRRLYGR